MHTNYYFLRQLAPALARNLEGLRFMECFSQDRDELVMVFAQARGKLNYYRPFYLKATLRPDFSGLLFPESVQRARTNSVDLFDELTGGEESSGTPVTAVRSFRNERCLSIELEGGHALLFKFFGNRPNLLIFKENEVADLFNNKLVEDYNLKYNALDRTLDQSWEAFEQANFDHRKLFPTFGKEVNFYLEEKGLRTLDGPDKWALLQETLGRLENPPRYYLTTFDHKPALTLVPLGEDDPYRKEFDNPLEATNRFYAAFMGRNTLERERGEVLRLLEKRLKRTQAYIESQMERLFGLDEGVSNEEIANILMANLHQIPEPAGARSPERIDLYDFYRDQPISIKLKPELSPQKNAETYYRKAKNEKIEVAKIQEGIEKREQEAEEIRRQLTDIAAIDNLRELRKFLKNQKLNDERAALAPGQLFKVVEHEGFTILIGRNAKNNDLLTQKYSFKEDLWLHARDVTGSHVLIKYQAGKKFPKTVIERAAQLAAWYSKRRTDTLCPVIVTPKKFVRKPKGLAEGQVVVDKEEVVLVEPREL
ncbi:NFACT RNA binding domain-containing protein [Tellurirhabdus rosea]|uniref:NFACT RNA binding domain-containing protein n=1 Tax=Tellurirhabdus rosea TaxID=2674997 RepID=UPI00224F22AE|nr:NFACT RNA binding domain-containing protein [Tellurirhabdus rosea]